MRIVVKVGSSTVLDENGHPATYWVERIGAQIRALKAEGHQVALVASGAVGAGRGLTGEELPREARAALGQTLMVSLWQRALSPYFPAQMLLLSQDLLEPAATHHRRTLEALLAGPTIPLLNENDVLAAGASAIGENDSLAAQVAVLLKADLVILLSNVDGVYQDETSTEGAPRPIPYLNPYTFPSVRFARDSAWGTGGMQAKLYAASLCWHAGIPVVIANGRRDGVVEDVMQGREIGTRIAAAQ